MKLNNEEQSILKTEMLLNGHTTCDNGYFDTNDYKKLRKVMFDHLPTSKPDQLNFRLITKKYVLQAGSYVIEKHFGEFDLKVPYADGDDLKTQLVAIFGQAPKQEQYTDIIHYINKNIELVKVTKVPLYLETCSPRNGYTAETNFYDLDATEEYYYKKIKPCLKEIAVKGNCDENAICIYVHEMAHALIDRHKKNVRNKLNDEVFSVFMEKVAANDLKPELGIGFKNLIIFQRILQIKRNILNMEGQMFEEENPLDVLRLQTYILSTLHATALFDTYDKGNNKLKKEIDNSLGNVIIGRAVLEDVLDHYEATPERGSKIMKGQIKTYEKKYNK